MTVLTDAEKLAQEILQGSDRALAKGLTSVERGGEFAELLLAKLYPSTGRAHVVGLYRESGQRQEHADEGLSPRSATTWIVGRRDCR